MKLKCLLLISLLALVVAAAGCTSPTPAVSPTPVATPTEQPTVAPTATPEPTATPVPTPTPVPSATPRPAYGSGGLQVSNVTINWDTSGYNSMATETATMDVKDISKDTLYESVELDYLVSTPAVSSDGNKYYNNITKTSFIGLLQPGDKVTRTFNVDHPMDVPVTIVVTMKWKGGSETILQKTVETPYFSFFCSESTRLIYFQALVSWGMDMRCLMCERKYSEKQGDIAKGFCSKSCKQVYEHIYGADERSAIRAVKAKA
jgi:hypothetical protein